MRAVMSDLFQRPLYIFDLDGTLANCDHRLHLRERGDFEAFYNACHRDTPIHSTIHTLNTLSKEADIWIFTGRSERVYASTRFWLTRYTALSGEQLDAPLVMRPPDDRRPDHLLKRDWYDRMLPADRERLVAVFEDRQRVVDMWRELGVTCFQVAPGAF